MIGLLGLGTKRIFPFACHDAPRPQEESSVIVCVASLSTSMRRSAPETKYPTERESGDQKGKIPPLVSGRTFASKESIRRSHSSSWFVAERRPYTIIRPSGEIAGGASATPLSVTNGYSMCTERPGTFATVRLPFHSVKARIARSDAATSHGTREIQGEEEGTVPFSFSSSFPSSSNSASPAERRRCLGSFARQRRSSVLTLAGVSGGSALQSGSVFKTDASVSLTVSPSNGRLPVSISYRSTPSAQVSARLSTARPRACSGLM